ncbi:MAG: GNAT family N-acetyltransferase [Clostridiales bacterium]|nr:GNAT family N-acetyltransferase [Clostridiales bacterium]
MKRYNIIMLVDASGEQLLMCQRRKPPYQGLYNLVGGKAEPGEDGLDAAYRELREETGVTAADVTLHPLVTFTYANGGAGLPPYALEAYVGRLRHPVEVRGDENPLLWMPLTENFFDMERFAGEGIIGHVVETVRRYRPEMIELDVPAENGQGLPCAAQHKMSLRPEPFGMIAEGRKRYELRLNDEKRRRIAVGDIITFTCTADERSVTVRVTSLQSFPDFAALYAALPLTECGYTAENVATADPRDMERYYPPERQRDHGVLAIGVERIRLPLSALNGEYAVRELTDADVPEMLRVARSNSFFYRYMRPDPTPENLAADLTALPPRRTMADKHFFGWFEGDRLVAMMDLITHHPEPDKAFIGWFILDGARQGQGLGKRLVRDVLAMLKAQGVHEVRLGRIEGNPQSEHFWHACGFAENGLSYDTADYRVLVMAKRI